MSKQFLFIHKYILLFIVIDYTCFADSETSAASWDLHCCSYWTDWVKNIFLSFHAQSCLQSPVSVVYFTKKKKKFLAKVNTAMKVICICEIPRFKWQNHQSKSFNLYICLPLWRRKKMSPVVFQSSISPKKRTKIFLNFCRRR